MKHKRKAPCAEGSRGPSYLRRPQLQTLKTPLNYTVMTSADFHFATTDLEKEAICFHFTGQNKAQIKEEAGLKCYLHLPALWMLGLPWRGPPQDHRVCFCFGFWLLSIVRRTTASWRSLRGQNSQWLGSTQVLTLR